MPMKLVKVDNWGIYFLQRLKHFFNRTDYCDLTLQFQDNAQLKVHRLVLNACTEYFELLERTCEMYEDCLIMPDDLQADVVVPIVNFMYTGSLEFRPELLDKLLSTSQIMNMPVLTKLLDAQKYQKTYVKSEVKPPPSHQKLPVANKRSYEKAFEVPLTNPQSIMLEKPPAKKSTVSSNKVHTPSKTYKYNTNLQEIKRNASVYDSTNYMKRKVVRPPPPPRPTRYEIPEEFACNNDFDDSFTDVTYESKPLVVHPDAKQYEPKKEKFGIFSDTKPEVASNSIMDIVECRKVESQSEEIFDDVCSITEQPKKISNSLFDQILDENDLGKTITIEAKDSKMAAEIDHAKIISEVLKKYPHLVKGNKSIKLKILDTTTNPRQKKTNNSYAAKKPKDMNERHVMDSQEAARLISLGAENIDGPWICLICGTPGRAIHFPTYYKFRRHLVEVHNEKPICTICEYCGFKTVKRNILYHHLYSAHSITPPPPVHFPKCNVCGFIALCESRLVQHKTSQHSAPTVKCHVCFCAFKTTSDYLQHIKKTGHKIRSEKNEFSCTYCNKQFVKDSNLVTHIKVMHKNQAILDGIIEESDDEETSQVITYDNTLEECMNEDDIISYSPIKHQINTGANSMSIRQLKTQNRILNDQASQNDLLVEEIVPISQDSIREEIVMSNAEFVNENEHEYYIDETETNEIDQNLLYTDNTSMIDYKPENCPLPIEFVVSNEEKYDQSVVYDEESPKTLAVLTTPHTSKMAPREIKIQNKPKAHLVLKAPQYTQMSAPTEIDVQNAAKTLAVLTTSQAQATTAKPEQLQITHNEMIVLPEQYPLNVSQAVTNSNGNFVVVYGNIADGYTQNQIVSTHQATHYINTAEGIVTSTESIATWPSGQAQIIHHVQDPQVVQLTNIENVQTSMSSNNMQGATLTVNQVPTNMIQIQGQVIADAQIEIYDQTNSNIEENIGSQEQEVVNQAVIDQQFIEKINQNQAQVQEELVTVETINVIETIDESATQELSDNLVGETHTDTKMSDLTEATKDQEVDKNIDNTVVSNSLTETSISANNESQDEEITEEQPSEVTEDSQSSEINSEDRDVTPSGDTNQLVAESVETESQLNTKENNESKPTQQKAVITNPEEPTEAVTTNPEEPTEAVTTNPEVTTEAVALVSEWSEEEEEGTNPEVVSEQIEKEDNKAQENNTEDDNTTEAAEESIESIQEEVNKHLKDDIEIGDKVESSNLETNGVKESAKNIEPLINDWEETVSVMKAPPPPKPVATEPVKADISNLVNDWSEDEEES